MNNTAQIERRISIAMRVCVAIAAAFMLFGFVLLLLTFEDNFAGLYQFDIAEIATGLIALNPYSYMIVGIFLLIMTPIVRLVSCLILFSKEKDKLYIFITLFVIFILVVSFVVGFISR